LVVRLETIGAVAQRGSDQFMVAHHDGAAWPQAQLEERAMDLAPLLLGQAPANKGLIEPAREAFASGASLFKALQDPIALLELLCQHSQCELAAGDTAAARQILDLAVAMTEQADVNPGAALQARVDALRLTVEAKLLRSSVG